MIVTDTSVVVKLFAAEDGSDLARKLLMSGEEFAAPDLLMLEVANALMSKVRRSELLEVHAERSLTSVPDIMALLYPSIELLEEAWLLAFQLRHAVYDCVFLALALRLEVRLVTADLKFPAKTRALCRRGADARVTAMTGGCACGRVRFSADVASDEAYLCHCRMCQRATGSISIAFTEIEDEMVRRLSEPDWYDSSSIARRPFCARCGTSLGFAFKDRSRGRMDLTIASFDDPSRFRPLAHAGAESLNEAWIDTSTLPRHPTNPASEAATRRDRGESSDAA